MTSSSRKVVLTANSPQPIGPYSQAVSTGSLVFLSGSIGVDPKTKAFAGEDVETQTDQTLKNMREVLIAAGSSLEHVVKTNVFLADMADFPKFNAVYAKYFPNKPPARSTVAVKGTVSDGQVCRN